MTVNVVMQEYLDSGIRNLEVKALTFDETKIEEMDIDQEVFQVASIYNNRGTNACTFLLLDMID